MYQYKTCAKKAIFDVYRRKSIKTVENNHRDD